jgi:hypothetical protein
MTKLGLSILMISGIFLRRGRKGSGFQPFQKEKKGSKVIGV